MKIWHVNVGNHAGPVDGVAVVATQLAGDQAAAGHDVRLVVAADADHHDDIRTAAGGGLQLTLTDAPRPALLAARSLLKDPVTRPDVLHLHSVFRPAHRLLAWQAQGLGIPVVLSPHSGLAPILLQRDRWRKALYGRLVERRLYRTADGVHALQAVEHDDVVRYSSRTRPVTVIPNPVDAHLLDTEPWTAADAARPANRPPRVVLLCRYDVYQKGLDRLAAVAGLLPEIEFDVHGSADKNQPEAAEALISGAPQNLRFKPPVYGQDKLRTLREADLFLQPSRVEGLSIALAEAMALGVPCGVSRYVGDSLDVAGRGTGLVLDDEPGSAAAQIAALLADRPRLIALGRAARHYAYQELHPDEVTRRHIEHYIAVSQARSVGATPLSGRTHA